MCRRCSNIYYTETCCNESLFSGHHDPAAGVEVKEGGGGCRHKLEVVLEANKKRGAHPVNQVPRIYRKCCSNNTGGSTAAELLLLYVAPGRFARSTGKIQNTPIVYP